MKVYFLSFFRDVIKIKSTCVDVTSILNKRVRSLPGVILNKRKYNNDKVDITISFEKSGIFIDFLDVKYVYENINIYNTDIYPIIYSVLYKLFLKRGFFGIHATVVKKEHNLVMVIGDFNHGKSFLTHKFSELGWKCISTDQTLCKINNGVCFIDGSIIYKNIKGSLELGKEVVDRPPIDGYLVKTIIYIEGLAENGLTYVKEVTNPKNSIRKLWRSMSWPWNTPLFSLQGKNIIPELERESLFKTCSSIINNVNLYTVRGDASNIATYIEKEDLLE